MFPILRNRRSRDMAKVLPFVPKPAPLFSRKRRRKPPSPRGVSFTLQINADDVATELIKQLEDKAPSAVNELLKRLEAEERRDDER